MHILKVFLLAGLLFLSYFSSELNTLNEKCGDNWSMFLKILGLTNRQSTERNSERYLQLQRKSSKGSSFLNARSNPTEARTAVTFTPALQRQLVVVVVVVVMQALARLTCQHKSTLLRRVAQTGLSSTMVQFV